MKTTKITKQNLIDNTCVDAFLYCPVCGGEYSANPGDYWNLPPEHVFKCNGCSVDGMTLELMRKVVTYKRVPFKNMGGRTVPLKNILG